MRVITRGAKRTKTGNVKSNMTQGWENLQNITGNNATKWQGHDKRLSSKEKWQHWLSVQTLKVVYIYIFLTSDILSVWEVTVVFQMQKWRSSMTLLQCCKTSWWECQVVGCTVHSRAIAKIYKILRSNSSGTTPPSKKFWQTLWFKCLFLFLFWHLSFRPSCKKLNTVQVRYFNFLHIDLNARRLLHNAWNTILMKKY